ncbi:MAG: phosphotransferase, partial [Fimbriimonadaceae bacterium]
MLHSVLAAQEIAAQFSIPARFDVTPFGGRGNINLDTFMIECTEGRYLLQRINTDVFALPERVMAGMEATLRAQSQAVREGHAPGWLVPELVDTNEGRSFLKHNGQVWRMMRFIPDTVSYKSLSELPSDAKRLQAASEMGRGLATYLDLTESIDAAALQSSLPGYRDTRLYFDQLDSALEGRSTMEEVEHLLPLDPEIRACSLPHFMCTLNSDEREARRNDPELAPFIEYSIAQRGEALGLQEMREGGQIRQVAIHGDTKIENFLFDVYDGRVRSLVDLDTVMPHSWLADWGDMLRSLVNVAGERERDLSKVRVNQGIYNAVTEGFLLTTKTATDREKALMPSAVKVITVELGVRFLADYLRGDTYFQLGADDAPDLNKVRAMVQL